MNGRAAELTTRSFRRIHPFRLRLRMRAGLPVLRKPSATDSEGMMKQEFGKGEFGKQKRGEADSGAGDEIRTHDPNLGKVVLYP